MGVRSMQLANPIPKRRICCSAFKTGMQCFDLYAATCLNGDEQKVMNRNVAGARHAFSYLCYDPSFQTGNVHIDNVFMEQNVNIHYDICLDNVT
jgi:hypothetical protein